jgi:hypothetical protein
MAYHPIVGFQVNERTKGACITKRNGSTFVVDMLLC